ncbi:MAG: hypothetical protein AAFZ04_00255, partial [Pseudomonadota bacterium]
MTDITIAETTADDIATIQKIVSDTGLFPPDLVPDLLDPALKGDTSEFWRSAYVGHKVGREKPGVGYDFLDGGDVIGG